MIEINDKAKCCGCGACVNKCPRGCISIAYDDEGFMYPQVDLDSCVDCGICEKVCPILNVVNKERKPLEVYAAINENESIRIASSSGGLFTAFAEFVLQEGGIVLGAAFTKDWKVAHECVDHLGSLSRLRGSKYIQSEIKKAYRQTEKELKEGELVLFTGTPCQIAGLRSYLQRDYDSLLTIDILCHGVPSTRVFQEYIRELAKGDKISSINMRSKVRGWKSYHLNINDYSVVWSSDIFMRAFIGNLILRPSCYECKFKTGRCGSDVSLGDFWGVKKCHKELDDDKGLSLVLINTEKGRRLFESLGNVKETVVKYEESIILNDGIIGSVKPHRNRARFFEELQRAVSVTSLMERMLQPPVWIKWKYAIASSIYKLIHSV